MNGIEWVVEAHGCSEDLLRSPAAMQGLFHDLIHVLKLNAVTDPQWHQFPGTRGITGLCLLTESHLACHTFPEFGSLCLNVFCCRPRPDWDFDSYFRERFGAATVTVRKIERQYVLPSAESAAQVTNRGSY